MRPPTIDDEELLDRLTTLFQAHGYTGVSLSMIAEATGLQRASLYHRFPGGKEQIAEAMLQRIDERFADHVLAPVAMSGPPRGRVRTIARRLGDFYDDGRRSCILDTLSLGDSNSTLREHLGRSFKAWIDAFTAIAREAGLSPAVARRQAEDAVIRVQGALVMARNTGDRRPLKRVLRNLPDDLLKSPTN